MRIALSDAGEGLLFVSGHVLDDDSADRVPVELLGRLLTHDDLRKLPTHAHQEKAANTIGAKR